MAAVASVTPPSLSLRILGALVPTLCLAGALVVWEIWRVADAVTESESVPVALYRVAVHVAVVFLPLAASIFATAAPPRSLSPRGYAGLATLAAVVAVAWTPLAMFLTYALGA